MFHDTLRTTLNGAAVVPYETSEQARKRWNARYAQGRVSPLHATLVRFYRLAPVGRALELACGTGTDALFLALRGFQVDALDISEVAIRQAKARARAEGVHVRFFVCDAANFAFPPETYDLVVNFSFLERRTFPLIVRTLKPGGLLIFETFNVRHLDVRPDAPVEHLLRPGEVLEAFPALLPLYYREVDNRTTFVARKPRGSEEPVFGGMCQPRGWWKTGRQGGCR